MKKPNYRLICFAVCEGPGWSGLDLPTLSDSFRIRPPSIYRAPGIARPCRQMGHLAASEIQSFYPIRSPGGILYLIPACWTSD